VAGLTDVLQEDLFAGEDHGPGSADDQSSVDDVSAHERSAPRWVAGADVEHDDHGRGWVWGSGRGRVTVRFETRNTPPGPVRTFAMDDPALHLLS
jgi:DNA polymerase IV